MCRVCLQLKNITYIRCRIPVFYGSTLIFSPTRQWGFWDVAWKPNWFRETIRTVLICRAPWKIQYMSQVNKVWAFRLTPYSLGHVLYFPFSMYCIFHGAHVIPYHAATKTIVSSEVFTMHKRETVIKIHHIIWENMDLHYVSLWLKRPIWHLIK